MRNRRIPRFAARLLGGALVAAPVCGMAPQEPPPSPRTPVKPTSDSASERTPNHLADATSPYLRQHRLNPVDWYPWGEDALALARKLDKPIFLSIGYSACHWCHVMERESFENEEIAALLNENFVCIKVDREERPDLDEIYMAAVHAMGMQGGWPLSVWLLPDGRPFYGGTYFPPEDRYGRPGFRRVVESLARLVRDRREEVERGAAELAEHLKTVLAPELPPGEPTLELLEKVLPQSRSRYDERFGGFAPPPAFAPKFPHASELRVLLRLGKPEADAIVRKTLDAMARGGMFDQLGGGFHRYSTDREWLVPHFEKMLYDNALLVPCYLEAAERFGDESYRRVASETLAYLRREMQDARGGFYSSQDADSGGVEGSFFVWSEEQFDRLLGEDAAFGRRLFGVTAEGNWEGKNILVRTAFADDLSAPDERRAAKVRERLLAARAERVRPATDDKILCGWNGLAIEAMAFGYRELDGEDAEACLRSAQRAAAFALDELIVGGRCHRSWRDGEASADGVLEDYAMLAQGLIELFECDGDPRWLEAAGDLVRSIDAHFGAEDGGFWTTSDDHERLLARSKTVSESSTPSGAAAAVRALLAAGLLLGDEALYGRGLAALRQSHAVLRDSPVAAPSLVLALQFHLGDPREIVIAGRPDDPATRALLERAWSPFPGPCVVGLVHDGNRKALESLSPIFRDKAPLDGAPAAYVCRRGACEAPITDPGRLRR